MSAGERIRIPLDWVIVDALGAILTGAGVYGLAAGRDAALPILAQPGVAWLCVVVGVALMGLAMAQIVRRILQQRTRGG